MSSPLQELSAAGVSIWLDDLSRGRLETGSLADLMQDSSVVGVTTNPSIFQAALSHGERYDAQVKELAGHSADVAETVMALTTTDVRNACDLMRPVYDATHGVDGRVSIEVSPRVAHDYEATVAEARELWKVVDRPNALIKIPATPECRDAITDVLGDGISVNVTLIFGLDQYAEVMKAHIAGLEKAAANGHDLSKIHSVASFFVSRVDTEIDKRLEASGADAALMGKAGIANARLAFEAFEEFYAGPRWEALASVGAHRQRPLWASTGVKNPDYDDTMYVVDLAVEGTVNTMPEATLDAVRDHGIVKGDQVRPNYAHAHEVMDSLAAAGIDYDDVIEVLIVEGVGKFVASWDELVEAVQVSLDSASAK